jgi:hypothetical protein
MTRAVAASATGVASTAKAGRGRTWRVASKAAHTITVAVAAMATCRAVSPARILSGRSMSAGIGTGSLTS